MKVERIEISKIKTLENSRGSTDKSLPQLMSSIQQHGLQQPIGVNYNGNGSYEIMYGNRRLHACSKLGWKTIPAVLYTEKSDKDQLINNLVENIQRENISPAEIGRICSILEKDKKLTKDEIAVRLGLPKDTIVSMIHLYHNFPESLRKKVVFAKGGQKKDGQISMSNVGKVLSTRNKFGLKPSSVRKIMEHIQIDNLSSEDIQIIGSLMQEGLPFNKALLQRKQYKAYRVNFIALEEEVNELAEKARLSPLSYIVEACYGNEKPLSKPSFIKINKGKQ